MHRRYNRTVVGTRTQHTSTAEQLDLSAPQILPVVVDASVDAQQPPVAAFTNEPASIRPPENALEGRRKEIELVPPKLHEYLFACPAPSTSRDVSPEDPCANLELPPLRAQGDLMKHFHAIATEQFQSYQDLLERAMRVVDNAPSIPHSFLLQTGWVRYDSDGTTHEVVFPDEDVLFFDVEVCVTDGHLPTMAVALSENAWYCWCSDRLVNGSEVPALPRFEHMVPLEQPEGSDTPKIVIGHNVAYDRSRIREQYYPKKTATRFWDTMSMAIAVCGMADHQRNMYAKNDVDREFLKEHPWIDEWRKRVCRNSLEAVHTKFCGDTSQLSMDKTVVDAFVKHDIHVIRENFQRLAKYCAEDVLATCQVFKPLYSQFPHPVTSVGMMEMASAYLPVTENWRRFFETCEEQSTALNADAGRAVINPANDLLEKLRRNKGYEDDPWMWVSEWSHSKNYAYPEWFLSLFKTKKLASADADRVSPKDICFRCREVPRIFGLCYGWYPLYFKNQFGWGFLVPFQQYTLADLDKIQDEIVLLKRGDDVRLPNRAILELILNNQESVPEVPIKSMKPVAKVGIFDFYRLPHPKKTDSNVGSPFVKDFRKDYETEVLWATRYADELRTYLSTQGITRFWTNYRSRYNEQLTVWFDKEGKSGAIAPSIIPSGTKELLGSELKSMIQCSPGWKLVGADVDSQEQWIAALLGDCATGQRSVGVTAFSNMLLAGSKSDQSDLHSVVAKTIGISRDNAKASSKCD
ncbi:DNA polymerase I family protein [Aphelenchoides avenae]|nr:DNA polymerase I family protein [Aphelenchus avenae]